MVNKEQSERIKQLQDSFKFDDEACESERLGVLDKINTLKSIYDAKVQAFDNREQLDGVESIMFAEYISLSKLLGELWNDVLRLDNRRSSNIQRLVNILLYSDLNKKLIKEVKDYEY